MTDSLTYLLPVVWALVIGTAVALYVMLDGFDLGIGILFPFFKDEASRDVMMDSIAPFWDGNETWLVLGGAGLFVAFPIAYAVIMPAVYLPVIVMLLALIFRGVAFEFRGIAKPHHRKWDASFTIGSTVAAFFQGVILGTLLQGIPVQNNQFGGGPLDWLTPFSIMCGIGLVIGYALLGAGWLMVKTEGTLEQQARRLSTILLLLMLVFIVLVSVWTPIAIDRIRARWFAFPNLLLLSPLPVATLLAAWSCWYGIRHNKPIQPFASAVALFLLSYIGLVISNVPYLVPPSITIWEAASSPSTQFFMLIGTLFLLPIILGYTALVFWIFRGKVRYGEGYH